MDAHVFRYLLLELRPRLLGKRVDRVYQPGKEIWTLRLGSRKHLLLRVHSKQGALLWSPSKPDNPEQPSSRTLWWRKRIGRRKIAEVLSDWPNRRAALLLEPGEEWLLLDIVRGLDLWQELPPGFGSEPDWPDSETALSDPQSYRDFPQMTPLLRNSLARRDYAEAWELLRFVREERPSRFYLCNSSRQQLVAAWHPAEQLDQDWQCQSFFTAEEAAYYYGWRILSHLASGEDEAAKEQGKALKKTRKKLARVQQDEERLRAMAGLYETAQLLQMNIYHFDPQGKYSSVEVLDSQGNRQKVELDPGLSLLQNMESMFQRARKGSRGLEQVARRRQELERELEAGGAAKRVQAVSTAKAPGRESGSRRKGRLAPRLKGLQVAVYRSGDNYTILRGKNKRSNHKLLSQAAGPFDLWFHAENGPGAHVILQRDYAGQEVPRESILEAAMIAGMYSDQALADKARVICAPVKDVRPIKGAELGQVRVDTVLESLLVELDSGREQEIRLE